MTSIEGASLPTLIVKQHKKPFRKAFVTTREMATEEREKRKSFVSFGKKSMFKTENLLQQFCEDKLHLQMIRKKPLSHVTLPTRCLFSH